MFEAVVSVFLGICGGWQVAQAHQTPCFDAGDNFLINSSGDNLCEALNN